MSPVTLAARGPVVLDRQVLLRSVQSNTALLRRVVDLLAEQGRQATAELHLAAGAGDAPAVRRVAHRLKGALLSVGAFAAATAADRVLDIAVAVPLEGLPTALAQLAGALDAVAGELALLVAEHGA